MIEELFAKKPKKKIQDLNIVPILDMLTTVIFFLLLSTTFLEYIKLMVPPSQVSTTQSEPKDRPKAYAPKLLLTQGGGSLKMTLTWSGSMAGRKRVSVDVGQDLVAVRPKIQEELGKLMKEFSQLNSTEKTLQIGLGSSVPYQHLITAMDGVREVTPEVVLISYAEAEALGGAP